MRTKELFRDVDIIGGFEADFSRVTSDSRRVVDGCLFICRRGIKRDGHDYAPDAISHGARAVLVEEWLETVPREKQILTLDTALGESYIWRNYYGDPLRDITTIAITGTAGKSTVAYLLGHILSTCGRRVGMMTTIRSKSPKGELDIGPRGGSSVSDSAASMTTPDPEYFFRAARQIADDGADTLIYEASSQSLLYKKQASVRVDCAIFTNLSPEHLDAHGTMDEYFRVKSTLMERAKTAVINIDDGYISRIPEIYPDRHYIKCSARCDKVGESHATALRKRSRGVDGVEFCYFSERAVFRLKVPMVGMFNIMNATEAVAAALYLGCDPMTVKEAVEGFPGVDGRMYQVDTARFGFDFAVFIDYAHTPEELKQALSSLREVTEGKLTVLFGCGGDRDPAKRPLMGKIALDMADFAVVTSDNPRNENPTSIMNEITAEMSEHDRYTVIENRSEAIRYALTNARAGDTVLLAGKGHEKYEIRSGKMIPYDEEAVVLDTLRIMHERK